MTTTDVTRAYWQGVSPFGLSFDEAEHRYEYLGEPVPSVTTILKACGDINAQWFTREAQLRGTLVHQATQMVDLGLHFDWPSTYLAEEAKGYAAAWHRFVRERQVHIFAVEVPLVCPTFRYAGTTDRLACVNGKNFVLDLKTGDPMPWHRLQLAAYARVVGAPNRAGVYLRADGTYKFKPYPPSELRSDELGFLKRKHRYDCEQL